MRLIKKIKKYKKKILNLYYRNFDIKKIQEESLIELELSNICNANCIFCPYPVIKMTNKKFKIMEKETFDKILKKIEKQYYKRISFTPTTGEILTNKNWDYYIKKVFYLKNITNILFYSNAILLNEENIEKLLNLLQHSKNKITDIHFSIGGIDRKTYHYMYGVDKYNQVKENINLLLEKLKFLDLKVSILLELRLPKEIKITENEVLLQFNKENYKNFKINILQEFIKIPCLSEDKRLNYLPLRKKEKLPCLWLYKTRYDVNGGIWADGCVISEGPNDVELRLGSVDDTLEMIEESRKKIIHQWKKGKLPLVCQGCQFYRSYSFY